GNGHAKPAPQGDDGSALASSGSAIATAVAPAPAMAVAAVAEQRVETQPTELMPFVIQGVCDGLRPPDAGNDAVEPLLVRPLPWWKRAIDIVGAGTGLLLASPVMAMA